jgi:pyruvate dehydrogenase E1 component
VLAGGYRIVEGVGDEAAPVVTLVGTGAILPEVVAAAAELSDEGVVAHVVDVTSGDRLYRAWQHAMRAGIRSATKPTLPSILRDLFPVRAPLVTVHDGASHTMSWLGSALGVPAVSLGVDEFGQTGSISDLYDLHDLSAGSIVNGALAALSMA